MKTTIIRRYLPFMLTVSLTSVVYLNSIYAPFQFDDIRTIVKNPDIKTLVTDTNLNSFISLFTSFFSRPVLFATLKINYYFGGLNTFGYHLINVILHVCVSFLIYLIASTISKEEMKGLPLLSSLIFAVHPVNTEAVTYIISRSILLSTFFGLLTLLFFIKGVEGQRMKDEGRRTKDEKIQLPSSTLVPRPSCFWFLASCLFFILALGTREDAAILPVLIALYYLFFLKSKERDIIIFFIILILSLAYPLTRYIIMGNIGVSEATKFTPLTYLITEINVIVYYYIRLIIFPFNLNVDPDIKAVSSIDMATIIAIAFIVFLFFLFGKSKILLFSLLWFFITIAPTSSIIPLLDAAAEHRVYLSMVGGSILISGCLYKISCLRHQHTAGQALALTGASLKACPTLICIMIVFLSIGAIKRNNVWNSEVSLWMDTARKSPFKARVYNALGLAYKRERGDYERALEYYNKALILQPLYADARINKGVIFTLKGDFDEALKEFELALTLKPNSPQLHNNMGVIYIKKGYIDRAIKEFQSALKINPKFEDARKNLQLIRDKQSIL